MSLEEPFPSCPARPGRFVIYAKKGDREPISIFYACYAAKKYLEALLDGEPYVLEGDTILKSESGLFVRSDTLPEILEHKYTKEEAAWELPHPYDVEAYFMRYGKRPDNKTVVTREITRERKVRRKRAPRTGLVPVGDIAEQLGLSPREARGRLRKAKVQKPDAGWAWPESEVEDIKTLIAGAK